MYVVQVTGPALHVAPTTLQGAQSASAAMSPGAFGLQSFYLSLVKYHLGCMGYKGDVALPW